MLRLAANLLHCFIYGQSKRSPKAQRVSPPKLFVVPDAAVLLGSDGPEILQRKVQIGVLASRERQVERATGKR
jgi:hypothetical protein